MPTLSMFYGIVISMYQETQTNHHIPHFHAYYQSHSISMDFDGNILSGTFPKRQLKLLYAWVELHKEELQANWDLLSKGNGFFKINPLQ